MKDRAMGLLTTAAILALPGMILAADRWSWFAGQLTEHPGWAWVGAMVLLAVAGVLLGFEKRGYWDGLLIDATNRKSLSRLQSIVWGTLIISGIATGIAVNVARGCELPAEGVTPPAGSCTMSPWDLHYPEQFLVLAALSATILVLAAVANGANAQRSLTPKANLSAQAAYLDLTRVQFLIVSLLVAGAYAVFFLRELTDPAGSVTFPEFDAGLNTLLGISAAAYLGTKMVNGVSSGN